MTPFATLDDVAQRYPRELTVLAADETTGIRDDARIEAALADVTVQIAGILLARYRRDELARLDGDSLALLRTYAIPLSLFAVALSFARSSETVEKRADRALVDLRAIAAGKGALTFDPDPAAIVQAIEPGEAEVSNTAVLLEAPERVFTRARLRGM